MEDDRLEELVQAVVAALVASGAAQPRGTVKAAAIPPATAIPPAAAITAAPAPQTAVAPMASVPPQTAAAPARPPAAGDLSIDLEDPSRPEARRRIGIAHPADPDGLAALLSSTGARIGVGRAGPRPRTASLLLFQADHAITRDALLREVDPGLLEELGLFTVETQVEGGIEEYLLRPDLGRRLSERAAATIAERCVKSPRLQICVGDGLSARAIEANLRKILPVLVAGASSAGLSLGTPFFIHHARVGVMNDIGDLLQPEILVLLIGERPGLGRADSMSVYMAYRPRKGQSDADRDVICNIFDGGGTNPLEAGAYTLRLAQKMLERRASGVRLRLMEG
jgi:ethanolamine ammonia-lyase small subunit